MASPPSSSDGAFAFLTDQVLATVVPQSVQGPCSPCPAAFQSLVLIYPPTHSSTHLILHPPPLTYLFTCPSDSPPTSPPPTVLSHNHLLTLLSTHPFTHSSVSPSIQAPVLPSLHPLSSLSTWCHSWDVQAKIGLPQVHYLHSFLGPVRLALHCMFVRGWSGMVRSSLRQGLQSQQLGSG